MTDREKELIAVIEKALAAMDIRVVRVEIRQADAPCEEHRVELRTMAKEIQDMKTKWAFLIATVVMIMSFVGTALARWWIP